MPEVVDVSDNEAANPASAATTPVVVSTVLVVGLFLLLLLYLGLSRYYNARELASLVEGAQANGKSYSVVVHNGLTGRYSFNVE